MAEEVRVRLARARADYDACVELLLKVWSLQDVEVTSAIQMIATTFAGGTVHVAEAESGQAVGFAYAFPAITGGPHLHSDMLAVLPDYQKRGVGVRLKWAQREDALARGLTLITWTFDPLQAVNAHLNLRRLAATATEFHENFYGLTSSALHHGFPTDRLLVRWQLNAPRVVERGADPQAAAPVSVPDLPRVNEVRWQAGWPVSSDPDLGLDAHELLLEIPPEWDVVCQAAPRVAQDWQDKVRRALRAYFDRGYIAADFLPAVESGTARDVGRRRPMYVLRSS
jgi:predicted GNAT superfamily acetyltransferase